MTVPSMEMLGAICLVEPQSTTHEPPSRPVWPVTKQSSSGSTGLVWPPVRPAAGGAEAGPGIVAHSAGDQPAALRMA